MMHFSKKKSKIKYHAVVNCASPNHILSMFCLSNTISIYLLFLTKDSIYLILFYCYNALEFVS